MKPNKDIRTNIVRTNKGNCNMSFNSELTAAKYGTPNGPVSYLIGTNGRSNKSTEQRSRQKRMAHTLKQWCWKLIISPLFLFMAIVMILLVPQKHLQARHYASRTFFVRVFKRILDVVGACVGLMLSSVLFLIFPVLIKLETAGSIFFRQTRIGMNRRNGDRRKVNLAVSHDRRKSDRRKTNLSGKPFRVYKFRSMTADAEKKIGAVWASQNDPRITKIGRIMRPLHIDEIPQYINVLKGEMSLVGPRPERPEFVEKLKNDIPDYEKRLSNKPGITGLAQVSCGYDSSMEDVMRKLKYDLRYINDLEQGELFADIKILMLTLKKIFFRQLADNPPNGK